MLKNAYGEDLIPRTQQELNTVLAAHERYVAYQGGKRAQLSHAKLDGLNLANRTLKEADLSGASLVGATLYGSNLELASLYCADLRGCNLQSADLTRADLRGASLKGACLSYAVLDGADLRAATMMYIRPDHVSVLDRNQNGDGGSVSTAAGVDFTNSSLKYASFGSAKLDGVNFTGALLEGTKFKGAQVKNATFTGAVLTGVNLNDLDVPAEMLADCITDTTPEAKAKTPTLMANLAAHQDWISGSGKASEPAVFDVEDLRPLKRELAGRVLSALSLRNTIAIGLDFSGCHLQAAKFDGADLRDADFSNADLRGASFKGAKLAHARFDGANLGSLTMASGTVIKPDFTGSDAVVEQFLSAHLEDPLSSLGLTNAR